MSDATPISDPNPPIGSAPRRFAFWAAVAALPLFAFGGSVTTLGAGMAVEGWWNAEGHFLPFFPVEKWFRDGATFVEHTHRLFGMVVGLLGIGMVVATFRATRSKRLRLAASAALLAICAQGALGGFRVLENSPQLAFLHGVFGQGVFALLVATAVMLSPAYTALRARVAEDAAPLHRIAGWALGIVFVQIALGAWYRHGLRGGLAVDPAARLGAHVLGALIAFGAVMALAAALERTGDPRLGAKARGLRHLLLVQIGLGMGAWMFYTPEAVPVLELVFSVAHVVVGALLLARTAGALVWSRRTLQQQATTLRTGSVAGKGAAA